MREILITYAVAVLLNRTMNWFFWWGSHREAGLFGYYREHGPMLLATLLFHVPGFVLWWSGALLPLVNGALTATIAGLDAIPGVDLSTVQLPTQVTALNTLCYGWPLDSLVSRLGMKLGSKFALFGGNGAARKETP